MHNGVSAYIAQRYLFTTGGRVTAVPRQSGEPVRDKNRQSKPNQRINTATSQPLNVAQTIASIWFSSNLSNL